MDTKKSEVTAALASVRPRLTIEVPSDVHGGAVCTCTCVVCDPSTCATCHSGTKVFTQVGLPPIALPPIRLHG